MSGELSGGLRYGPVVGRPRIIGVCGYMRTGKDSVVKLLGVYGYTRVAFADPLKKAAYDTDPYIQVTPDDKDATSIRIEPGFYRFKYLVDVLGPEKAKTIADLRRYLQRFGTEGVRNNIGDTTWVDLATKRMAGQASMYFAVSDVRFKNEASEVRKLGGVIFKTQRPGYGGGEHASEAGVDAITADVVLTAETLEDLGALVQFTLGVDPDRDAIDKWAAAIREEAAA